MRLFFLKKSEDKILAKDKNLPNLTENYSEIKFEVIFPVVSNQRHQFPTQKRASSRAEHSRGHGDDHRCYQRESHFHLTVFAS